MMETIKYQFFKRNLLLFSFIILLAQLIKVKSNENEYNSDKLSNQTNEFFSINLTDKHYNISLEPSHYNDRVKKIIITNDSHGTLYLNDSNNIIGVEFVLKSESKIKLVTMENYNLEDCPLLVIKRLSRDCFKSIYSTSENFVLIANTPNLTNRIIIFYETENPKIERTNKKSDETIKISEESYMGRNVNRVYLNDIDTEHIYIRDDKQTVWYSIISTSKFDIEFIVSENINWNVCPLAVIIDKNPECLQNNLRIFKENFFLMVKQSLLTEPIKISLRPIVNVCNHENFHQIDHSGKIPKIIYNSTYSCKLNISIPKNHMISFLIDKFVSNMPQKGCNTYIEFMGDYNTSNESSNRKVMRYCTMNNKYEKILIRNGYAIIEIGNVLNELVQIEIGVKFISSCGETFEIDENEKFQLSSFGLMNKIDKDCSWSIVNKNKSHVMVVNLEEYQRLYNDSSSLLLISSNYYESKIIVYDPNKSELFQDMFINNNQINIQFFRSKLNENISFDQFTLKIYTKTIKRYHFQYTKNMGYIMSINYPLIFPENSHVEHEIKVELGYRIVLTLESLNVNGCFTEDCSICEYGVEIKMNNNQNNHKLCGKRKNLLTFYNYGNSLIISFVFGKKHSKFNSNELYGYKFKYISIPICNHIYKSDSGVITYDNDFISSENDICTNTIMMNNDQNRIFLYSINWEMNSYNNNKHKNHLIISDSYFKHNKNEKKRIFSNTHTVISFVSDSNILDLKTIKISNSSPLAYEIGYMSFKKIYNKFADEFTIDYSQKIDKRANISIIEFLEYTIQVTDEYYLVPIIYNCKLNTLYGNVYVKTDKEIYPFNLECGNEYYTFLTTMTSKVTFELSNIPIYELRDKLKFSIKYSSYPRIFKNLNGSFESFNFSTLIFPNRNQNVEYTWIIDLESIYYVKLNLLNLINCESTQDLNIQDGELRIIYNKEQLCQNFNLGLSSYDFATNKILINLNYIRNSRSNFKEFPYLKCSYTSYLRVLTQSSGHIMLKNSHTHFKRNWLLKGPIDHVAVVSINSSKIDTNSQLIFSYLGTQYSLNGLYHLNFAPISKIFSDNRSIVISNSNLMKIEYISGINDEALHLSYIFRRNIYNSPCGIIKPLSNNNKNINNVLPKISDQKWLIKADNFKRIQINILFIDLPYSKPCSKSLLSFLDSNGDSITSLCGNVLNLTFTSKFSEVNVRLITQIDKDNDRDNEYKGFKLFYSFIEDIGDCYFQNKLNLFCGYSNIGDDVWKINENYTYIVTEDLEFSNLFCENCYIELVKPLIGGKLISPVLTQSIKSLKFDYKSVFGKMSVSIIPYNRLDQIITLPLNLIETTEWISAESVIHLSTPYQIMFEFLPFNNFKIAYAALDNIRLFESILTCQDHNSQNHYGCMFNESNQESCIKTTNQCFSNPCVNNGTCINNFHINSHICLCPKYFTGKNCDISIKNCKLQLRKDVVNCLTNDMLNSNNKKSSKGNYFLPCKTHENPCNELYGHGNCINQNKSKYLCSCDPNYIGSECEIKQMKMCTNNFCKNFDLKASCYESNGNSFCQCSNGFDGYACNNIDDCDDIICNNGGKCIDFLNSKKCNCTLNFIGEFCEHVKLCDACVKKHTIFCDSKTKKCLCHLGFTGSFCETKIDYCKDNPCYEGKCINKINNFECICEKGYKGVKCDIKISVCDMNPCHNDGTCILTDIDNSNFNCLCLNGYTGKFCQDIIDFCKNASCENGAKCFNEIEIYSCDCRSDYEGANCETKWNNCNNAQCYHDSTCIDLIGGYRCKCPPYKYGRYCNYTEDLCLNNMCVNGVCHYGSHSENQYTCECYSGYVGDFCEHEINECSSNPCLNGGVCFDLLDQFSCICPPKFSGKMCEFEINYCSLEKCIHNTTEQCIPHDGGFKCICKHGFTGMFCETKIGCSVPSPCITGECLNKDESYTCMDCLTGYTGRNCSEIINYCISNPCKNNGTCFSMANRYYCLCKDTFSGINCELDTSDVCETHKCKNNGICKPKINEYDGYECICDKNFNGKYCETTIDLCKGIECGFSYCVNGTCECSPYIPYCKKSSNNFIFSCLNGGTKIDVLKNNHSTPKCFCDSGLVGDYCEKSIHCSNENTCGSFGICKSIESSFECNCKNPLIGHRCIKKLDEYLKNYGNLLKAQKQLQIQIKCQFGYSKISKILICLITIIVITFTLVGFTIGHCIILAHKKNLYNISKYRDKINFQNFNDEIRPLNVGIMSQKLKIPRAKLND